MEFETGNELLWALRRCGVSEPVSEYQFTDRRWRFDLAWPEEKVAVEIEGQGPSGLGRHQRPVGFERDLEKYNTAAAEGWRVLRFTPSALRRDPWGPADLIARALNRKGG
jgi:very-short-patch-repair endonuclease